MPAVALQVLEYARVSERARDLLAQLPHQMQIGRRINARLRVLHAQQAEHDAVVDEWHG